MGRILALFPFPRVQSEISARPRLRILRILHLAQLCDRNLLALLRARRFTQLAAIGLLDSNPAFLLLSGQRT